MVSPLPDTGQTVSQDGRIYRRVDGMEELEDLRIYLNGLFAPEVTERLLTTGGDTPMYRDIDGACMSLVRDGNGTPERKAPGGGAAGFRWRIFRQCDVDLLDRWCDHHGLEELVVSLCLHRRTVGVHRFHLIY